MNNYDDLPELNFDNLPELKFNQQKRTTADYVFPSFMTKYQEKPGERTLLGDIFERPGAAVRSALMGRGYVKGAMLPENVPSFQEEALNNKYLNPISSKSTALNFVSGLPASVGGFAADIATNPADLFTILAPKVPGASTISKFIAGTKPAQALARFGTKERHIFKTAPKLQKESVDIYRQILRPTQGEVKTYEIRRGGNIRDPLTIAAEEQLPIGMSKEGGVNKLDTIKARGIVSNRINELDTKLSDVLKATEKTQPYIDLIEVKRQALAQARKNIVNDTEYKAYANDINKYMNDAINSRSRYVSGADLNEIKRGMYSVGYNATKPTSDKAARIIARIAKNKIESAYPDKNIKELNDVMGKYITLNKMLENAQGRVVAGGRLGKYFAQGIGAGVGVAVGAPVPYVGPIAGALGGRLAGAKAAEFLSNPSRLSAIAGKKAIKAGIGYKTLQEAMTGRSIMGDVPRRGLVKSPAGINRLLAVLAQSIGSDNQNIP